MTVFHQEVIFLFSAFKYVLTFNRHKESHWTLQNYFFAKLFLSLLCCRTYFCKILLYFIICSTHICWVLKFLAHKNGIIWNTIYKIVFQQFIFSFRSFLFCLYLPHIYSITSGPCTNMYSCRRFYAITAWDPLVILPSKIQTRLWSS